MTDQEVPEVARRLVDGDPEEGNGIRPAVTFADHSYPAYSRKQMIDVAAAMARILQENRDGE